MKHIWLIGMMGTGKTTLGERLARAMDLPFIDVDERIVADAGKTIAELFAEGETVFRRLEASMIHTIADGPASVVATGGGAILDPGNVAAMRATGTTVLLTATTDELVDRLSVGTPDRPLLRGGNDLERISMAREATYRAAADIIVDTTSRTVEEVESEVIECVGM